MIHAKFPKLDGTHVVAEYKKAHPLKGFLVVKSSYDLYKKSRPTHKKDPLWVTGLPDVWNHQEMSGTPAPDYITMTEDIQHWFLYLNITRFKNVRWTKSEYFKWFEAGGKEVEWAAQELSRALKDDRSHTNKWGMNNAKNYLTKETNREGLPQFMKIITGWARLKLYNGKLEFRNVAGVGKCVAFHAVNASKDLWQYNSHDHYYLLDEPFVTSREIRTTPKSQPYIHRDYLHHDYGNFSGKLVFPYILPNSDKSFYLYDWTRQPKENEVWEKERVR